MEEYMKSLKNKLFYIMGAEDYSLQEMAVRCGISKRKLEEILYGEKKGINLRTIVKISNGIHISVPELLSRKGGAAHE